MTKQTGLQERGPRKEGERGREGEGAKGHGRPRLAATRRGARFAALFTIGAACVASATLFAGDPARADTRPATEPASQPAIRFAAVDVYVDSKDQPLAAYQFELATEVGDVKIVGIEGGEHPAFKEPPFYDPAALSQNRVIIAAFNTGQDLPKGKTRVARVHVQITGDTEPEYAVKLHVAGSTEGEQISEAAATVEQGEAR